MKEGQAQWTCYTEKQIHSTLYKSEWELAEEKNKMVVIVCQMEQN